jgi:hypothetical protein
LGASYPAITLTVQVSPTAGGTVTQLVDLTQPAYNRIDGFDGIAVLQAWRIG